MDERLQFVARRLAGEPMADLFSEFGIARKTGYKIFGRYQECGVEGLTDRGRRPYRYANQLPFQVENFILGGAAHSFPRLGEVLVDANNLTTQKKALNGKHESRRKIGDGGWVKPGGGR